MRNYKEEEEKKRNTMHTQIAAQKQEIKAKERQIHDKNVDLKQTEQEYNDKLALLNEQYD